MGIMKIKMLKKYLENVRRDLSQYTKDKWDRILPIDEMLLDRWEKGKILGFGEGTNSYEHIFVYGTPKIGKNVWIGPFVILDATGGLEIGDGCDIAAGVHIYTHSTHLRCISERKVEIIKRPVKIGEYTFIGANSTVLPGVEIGHHSIVGAGSVVTKSFPPYSIISGVPAKLHKKSTKDLLKKWNEEGQ